MYVRKTILISVLLIFLAITILALIIHFVPSTAEGNGFERSFLNEQAKVLNRKPLELALDKICGHDSSHVYFASKEISAIVKSNHQLNNFDTIGVPFFNHPEVSFGFDLIVDSPTVSFYSRNKSFMIPGMIQDNKYTPQKALKLPTETFTRLAYINTENIVVRGFDSTKRKQVFKKVDLSENSVKSSLDLLSEGDDLGLSTDGELIYNPSNGRIFYIQYYQNRFFCLDSNLDLVYKGRTIDTTSINLIPMRLKKETDSSGRMQSTIPLRAINRLSFADSKHLYIVSSLIAENEKDESFRNNVVVDRYKIGDGSYDSSFYLPKSQSKGPKSVIINGGVLVALYPREIVTYSIKE